MVFQSGRFSQTIKIADLEHAAVIGAKRDHVCSPYICPPELARAICDDEQVEVNAKEDVWAVGVMVLRLMGLKNPFELGEGEDLPSLLAPIAALTEADVNAALVRAGVAKGSALASFLIGDRGVPGCLVVQPGKRATVTQLQSKGWISGNYNTQISRDGVGDIKQLAQKVDAHALKMEVISEDMQEVKGELLNVRQRVEAVRKTILNLHDEQVPLIFTLELCPKDDAESMIVSDEQARSLFGWLKGMFSRSNDLISVQSNIDKLRGRQKLKLRLLCQYTWEPVGEGYELDAPRVMVPKLLPLLSLAMKGSDALGGALAISRLFLGSLVAEVPKGVVEDAKELVTGLPEGLHAYPCVMDELAKVALKGDDSEDAVRKELDRFQQQEFRSFLKKHDPEEKWRGHLSKTPLADGTVIWVSKKGLEKLRDEGLLDTESVKLQEILEKEIEKAQRRFNQKLEEEQEELREKKAAMEQSGQQTHEDLERVQAELQELQEKHEAEREEQAKKEEAAREQFAQLHKEKMESLLSEDDATEQAKAMMGDLAKEDGDAAARIEAEQGKGKEKLRARLEERQKKRAADALQQLQL